SPTLCRRPGAPPLRGKMRLAAQRHAPSGPFPHNKSIGASRSALVSYMLCTNHRHKTAVWIKHAAPRDWGLGCVPQSEEPHVQLNAFFPTLDIGSDAAKIHDWAQAAEDLGYAYIEVPDHVFGATARNGWVPLYSEKDAFHETFVTLGFLAA